MAVSRRSSTVFCSGVPCRLQPRRLPGGDRGELATPGSSTPRSGEELARTREGPWAMAFSADSSLLAIGAIRSGVIRIWNPRSGEAAADAAGTHPRESSTLAWAPGKATGEREHRRHGEDLVGRGEATGRLKGKRSQPRPARPPRGGSGTLPTAPTARVIATASDDGSARLWEASSGAELAVLRSGAARKSRDRRLQPRRIAAWSCRTATVIVQIWSSDGRLVRTLRGHRGEVRSAEFSPDGRLIASGGLRRSHRATLGGRAAAARLRCCEGTEACCQGRGVQP